MAKELVFTATFKKNYAKLPFFVRKKFDQKFKLFIDNPRHPSLRIHRYLGHEHVWEAYLSDSYRFTFSVTQETIVFRNVGPHSIIDKGQV